ncbi:lipopolysaccharide biosynthesis protein [Gemmiger formicilis]|uniref:lipopolysaccharide biosynthesis protein n=1 Tax=Gemmiger formicilis TaxID=745368 RepID=UPI003991C226
MMSERKKGAILSYIQVVLSVAVSVIYVPVLLRYLGQSEYGLYQIVGSFFSYISVFESCMSTGVLRNYCNALGSQDREAADVTLSMAKVIYRVMTVLMAIVGVVVLFAFRRFYASSFSAAEMKESSAILLLLFANMMVTMLGSVYLTILTGHEKFTFLKVLAIIIQVAQPFFCNSMRAKNPVCDYGFDSNCGAQRIDRLDAIPICDPQVENKNRKEEKKSKSH